MVKEVERGTKAVLADLLTRRREGAVRLRRERAEAHRRGDESPHDLGGRFDGRERYRAGRPQGEKVANHRRLVAPGLGDTWRDQEHAKFAEDFKQTMKALKKFIEVSNQHTPYLLRKAQRIEEYLSQH